MSIELHPLNPARQDRPPIDLAGIRLACDIYAASLSEPLLGQGGPFVDRVSVARELFANLLADLWHLSGSYGLDLWALVEEAEATAVAEAGRAIVPDGVGRFDLARLGAGGQAWEN